MKMKMIFDMIDDYVDDPHDADDECIICNKKLSQHDEIQAQQCYNDLVKLRDVKRALRRTSFVS